jgi:peptidoglycan/xylan/chitin deacetylase (PgdA/CDA1 family)
MSPSLANLCFHGIGTPQRDLEPGEAAYWISQQLFHDVLDAVADQPGVRISFDDGNVSDIELGLPALLERRLDATFFVLAGRLDQPGSLSADDLRTLQAAGMRIGSHGMTHRPWRGMAVRELDRELVEARQVLSDVTGVPVDEAALPLGRYDRRLLSRVRREGYRHVHTSDRHRARPGAWLQPRYSIRHDDTVDSVRRDLLATPPLSKRVERTAVITAKRLR